MDFDFSQDQIMLSDSVRRWLDKTYGFEQRQAIVQRGGYSPDVWQQMAQLGLTALALPSEHGGLDGSPVDAMVVMQELGANIVLEPFAACALVAAGLVRDAGSAAQQHTWCPAMAEGAARLVLAHGERHARYHLNYCETTAQQNADGGWCLNGTKTVVPAGDHVNGWIVPARVVGAQQTDAITLFIVNQGTAGATATGYVTQDGSRAANLSLQQVSVGNDAVLGAMHGGLPLLQRAVDTAIAAQCAYAVGAMEKLLALTVEYLNTRKQFGQALSSFQALRHRTVDMSMALELARGMSYYATLHLNADAATRTKAVSAAKVTVAQSARQVAQQAVQLHGGIGVTQEYVAAHYFKALTQIELQLGDTQHHLAQFTTLSQAAA